MWYIYYIFSAVMGLSCGKLVERDLEALEMDDNIGKLVEDS